MSLASSNRDGGKTDEVGHLRPIAKIVTADVITGLNVSQRGAGANMSIDIAIGDGVIHNSNNYGHPVWNDAVLNKAVTTADPTNPRRDIVVLYIDYAQARDNTIANNTNGVVKSMIVSGTAAGSPSDPNDAAIQTAVGSGNPFIKLSRITLPAAAISVTTSMITDIRNLQYVPTISGWNDTSYVPISVAQTNSLVPFVYDLTFNNVDLTSFLSNYMYLRGSRTVAAPSKSTALNGTTQYYKKTSPNKLTFTDDFVVSAWIKLSSYTQGIIASRYNGTSGWDFIVSSSGQIYLRGFNGGSSNVSQIQSYASIPLNEWVHVSAQLDMSSFSNSSTTSYVMFNGVDVAASVTRGGTNPTALIQIGDLEIGSSNGGNSPFPGTLAQVAIYSAKVTQATIAASINQALTGSETNLASAYSFNNSISDLNTTTPNDLSVGGGSAVATNSDSPFAVGAAAGTYEYMKILNVAASTNTVVTVQLAPGSVLPTTGGLNLISFSTQDRPLGMPRFRSVISSARLLNSPNTTSTSAALIPGLSLNVYLPKGFSFRTKMNGKDIYNDTAGKATEISIYQGSIGSADRFGAGSIVNGASNGFAPLYAEGKRTTPSAGVYQFNVGWSVASGSTGTMDAAPGYPAIFSIEPD